MKIDWGASFFFTLLSVFYLMAWFKPRAPEAPRAAVTAVEYRANTNPFFDPWVRRRR